MITYLLLPHLTVCFFFHLLIISLGPSPSVISFYDIWPPARERQVLFCFVLHLKSTVSLNLTFTSRDPDSTGAPWNLVWTEKGTDVLVLGAFLHFKLQPALPVETGKSPVPLGLSFFRNKSSFDLMSQDLLQLWWFFWPRDFLFYYLSSSQSLRVRWISSFFRRANASSEALTWLESEDGKQQNQEWDGTWVCLAITLAWMSRCLGNVPSRERLCEWLCHRDLGKWSDYQLEAQDHPVYSDVHGFPPLWPLKAKTHVLSNTWLCNMF